MELTGRLTADAKVTTLTDERRVTNFTLVINERYRTKAGERREHATFFKCAYWLSSKVAAHLRKGAIVSVSGRVGMDVYKNSDGEPKGALTFHVNSIMFIAKAPGLQQATQPAAQAATISGSSTDDMPF